MSYELLLPAEADRLLRYPPNRSEELARAGLLPHIELPCGAIRFRAEEIYRLIRRKHPGSEVAHVN